MPHSAATRITPFVLTLNEAENLGRTLESLRWASKVVVVDSGSTDTTETIARSFGNVSWHVRRFDSFQGQSEFALHHTEIDSEYALALDADMALTDALTAELENVFLAGDYGGAMVPFDYRIHGRSLLGSMLRPQLRLFRRAEVTVVQEGHGHKFSVPGRIYNCREKLSHDDRKPLERWVNSQVGYSRQERKRILEALSPSIMMKLRRAGLMPLIAGSYAYLKAGGPLRGNAAKHYAWERVIFECLLSMRLMEAETEPPKY